LFKNRKISALKLLNWVCYWSGN